MANKSPLVLSAGAVEQLQSGDGIIAAAFASSGSVVLSPGGTGGVQIGTGGNARGQYAVDLQAVRAVASQVASGNYSALLGGINSTVSGASSSCVAGTNNSVSTLNSAIIGGSGHVIGESSLGRSAIVGGVTSTITQCAYSGMLGAANCSATGSKSVPGYYLGVVGCSGASLVHARWCAAIGSSSPVISKGVAGTAISYVVIAGGKDNTVSNDYGCIIGGTENVCSGVAACVINGFVASATGAYSLATGTYSVASFHGQQSRSSGRFTTNGDAQISTFIARRQTTNATPTELFLNGSSARLTVPEGSTYGFTIKVTARQTNDDFSVARYVFDGIATRNAGGNVSVQVTKTYEHEDDTDWNCAVDALTAAQAIRLLVTGKADNNINWVARIETEETFA